MQANLTAEDLKDKDVAEAVDCIINQFGGLKAVQRELRNRGTLSQKCCAAYGPFMFCFLSLSYASILNIHTGSFKGVLWHV